MHDMETEVKEKPHQTRLCNPTDLWTKDAMEFSRLQRGRKMPEERGTSSHDSQSDNREKWLRIFLDARKGAPKRKATDLIYYFTFTKIPLNIILLSRFHLIRTKSLDYSSFQFIIRNILCYH